MVGPDPPGAGHEVSAESKEEGLLQGTSVWVRLTGAPTALRTRR